MKKRLILIFVSIALIVAYVDLIDSCKKIDLAIEDSLQSRINKMETVSYPELLKFTD